MFGNAGILAVMVSIAIAVLSSIGIQAADAAPHEDGEIIELVCQPIRESKECICHTVRT